MSDVMFSLSDPEFGNVPIQVKLKFLPRIGDEILYKDSIYKVSEVCHCLDIAEERFGVATGAVGFISVRANYLRKEE